MRYLFSFLLIFIAAQYTYSQQIYATNQANSVTGTCPSCGVVNPGRAVSNGNLTDYSSFIIIPNLADVSVEQTIIFPSSNTNIGCDSLVIVISSNNSALSQSLLGGVSVQTFNGTTANNDSITGSALPFMLLNPNTKGKIALKPTAQFDRVKITLTSAYTGALDELRILYAYAAPTVIPSPQVNISNLTICQGTSVKLNAGIPGDTINWYDDLTGGNLLHAGREYTVTPSSSTTYYASAITTGCEITTRVPAVININPAPDNSNISSPSYVCPGNTATFTITNPQAGVNYSWFSSIIDQTVVGTGITYISGPLLSSKTIYLKAEFATTHCTTVPGGQAAVVLITPITIPTVTNPNVSICKGDMANLYVSTPDSNVTINWYDALTGGNKIFAGKNFQVAPLINTTYYVTASTGICDAPGPRIPAKVFVFDRPVVPDVQPVDSICEGTTAVIKINNLQSGIIYNLYQGANDNIIIASSNTSTIITPILSNSTTLYLDAHQPGGNCNLPSRVAVKINVKKTPAAPLTSTPPTICAGDSTKLTANSTTPGAIIEWYSDAIGGTLLKKGSPFTVRPTTTTTYYAAAKAYGCSSANKAAVIVTVNQSAVIKIVDISADGTTACQGLPQILSVKAPQTGVSYSWYAISTGGTALQTNTTSYLTDSLNANQIFYLDATVDATGCHFPGNIRVPVNVVIKIVATPTVSANMAICNGDSTIISANTAEAGGTIEWYSAAKNGTLLQATPSFKVKPAVTTTYYASTKTANCSSKTRTPVTVTVHPKAIVKTVIVPAAGTTCAGQTAFLSVDSPQSGVVYSWYLNATGGTALSSGNTYTTAVLSGNQTYYVDATVTVSGCHFAGGSRVPVNVIVKQVAAPYFTSTYTAICSGNKTSLTATPEPGGIIEWYSANNTLLYTGTSFLVNPTSTTIYFASTKSGACNSVKAADTVMVHPVASTKTITVSSACEGQTATLSVNSPQSGVTYSWFASPTGGTALATGTNFTTPSLNSSQIYYLDANTVAGNCGLTGGTRIPATITVNPSAAMKTVTAPVTCDGKTATLSVDFPQNGVTYSWFNASTGGTLLASGNTYTTPALSNNQTYYLDATVTATGCHFAGGNRVPASVVVKQVDAPKLASTNIPMCSGIGTKLDATVGAGETVEWYSANNTLLYTGSPFPVNPAATTTYFASTRSGACNSAKVAATVTVNPLAVPKTVTSASICEGQKATLSVVSPQTTGVIYTWFATATGGTALASGTSFITPNLSNNQTYYLDANTTTGNCGFAARVQANVSVKKVTTPTITSSPATICSSSPASLTATTEPGGTIEWYTTPAGGTPIGTGSPFTISPTSNTTYYAGTKSSTCSSQNRASTLVTVNPSAVAKNITPAAICVGQTSNIIIDTPENGVSYSWYDAATAGTLLKAGNTYTTPALTDTKTYYLDAVVAATNCRFTGGNRIPVTVAVNKVSISATGSSICKGNTAFLNASSNQTSSTFSWYADAVTNTVLATGANYQVMPSATTTYYVAAKAGNCSSERIAAQAAVYSICPVIARQDSTSTLYKTSVTLTVTNNDFTTSGALVPASIDLAPATGGMLHDTIITDQGQFIADNLGHVTFTPAENFTGMAKIQYAIKNSQNVTSAPAWIIVTVGPNAKLDKQTCIKNTNLYFNITQNDVDVDGINKSSIDLDPDQPGIQTSKASIGGLFVLKNDSVIFSPVKDFLGTTSIFYVLKDNKGILSHQTEILVTVASEQDGIFIPQGFSPNNDGVHDYFVIEGIETLDVSLTIYNRWGNVVFGEKHYKNNWDGSLNGAQDSNVLAGTKINGWGDESAPEGTYFYLVEFNNSALENRNGYVIISR